MRFTLLKLSLMVVRESETLQLAAESKFRYQHSWKGADLPLKERKIPQDFMFLLSKHIRKHSPVSLSRTLLIIWIAFLFRASGFTKPSPTGIHKRRNDSKTGSSQQVQCMPVFLKYSLLQVLNNSSSVSIFVFRIEWEIHRPLSAQRRVCCFILLTPLAVWHSCYVLNELVTGTSPQRADLLKEWIDSGTVVPVFLWAGSPSSTPSKISRRKKNRLAENSNTKKPLLQALALLLHILYSLEHSPCYFWGERRGRMCLKDFTSPKYEFSSKQHL